jgi:hypothetical protein
MSWDSDKYLRGLTVLILLLWNWNMATLLETPYPPVIVELYAIPLTRIFLLTLVLLSAAWCPNVGIMAALAFICLGADVISFTAN